MLLKKVVLFSKSRIFIFFACIFLELMNYIVENISDSSTFECFFLQSLGDKASGFV